jgi:hypothetical protein
MDSGFDFHMAKPMKIEDLLVALKRAEMPRD